MPQTRVWGATLGEAKVSGSWNDLLKAQSINFWELKAIQLALSAFKDLIQGNSLAVFCDNVTAVSYLKKEGGTKSEDLNCLSQQLLRWCESLQITLIPQFVAGALNVEAVALSRRNQVLGAEWNKPITDAIKIAKKQKAPDLIKLPVFAAE